MKQSWKYSDGVGDPDWMSGLPDRAVPWEFPFEVAEAVPFQVAFSLREKFIPRSP